MVTFNTVILGGHLGAEPEERRTAAGKLICNFTMATNRWDTKAEEETTDWHSVVCFDKQAEVCVKYLRKGAPVLVEGRLQMRKWEGADGKKGTKAEIVAQRVVFLGSRSAAAPEVPAEPARPAKYAAPPGGYGPDAIPF